MKSVPVAPTVNSPIYRFQVDFPMVALMLFRASFQLVAIRFPPDSVMLASLSAGFSVA